MWMNNGRYGRRMVSGSVHLKAVEKIVRPPFVPKHTIQLQWLEHLLGKEKNSDSIPVTGYTFYKFQKSFRTKIVVETMSKFEEQYFFDKH
jgi:hypothetical protein